MGLSGQAEGWAHGWGGVGQTGQAEPEVQGLGLGQWVGWVGSGGVGSEGSEVSGQDA